MDYASHFKAINDIADYIVSIDNSVRLNSNLGNLSPNACARESPSKNCCALNNWTTTITHQVSPPTRLCTAKNSKLENFLEIVCLYYKAP